MEIKRINGIISAYQTQKTGAPRKSSAAAAVKNTDRVEFGFDTALAAAKNGIAQEIKADAAPQELTRAAGAAEQGVPAEDIAAYILIG